MVIFISIFIREVAVKQLSQLFQVRGDAFLLAPCFQLHSNTHSVAESSRTCCFLFVASPMVTSFGNHKAFLQLQRYPVHCPVFDNSDDWVHWRWQPSKPQSRWLRVVEVRIVHCLAMRCSLKNMPHAARDILLKWKNNILLYFSDKICIRPWDLVERSRLRTIILSVVHSLEHLTQCVWHHLHVYISPLLVSSA